MKHELVTRLHKNSDDYVHVQEGVGFWFAWDSCKKPGHPVSDHFVDVNKLVAPGSGSERGMSGA